MTARASKPADVSQEDWRSVDVPEATNAEFATARPFKEVFPAQYNSWKKMGRPPVAAPKIHIGFRLAADVVQSIRATGRGYNARVEKVLRDALARGEL
ncbi:MAG TPA: BrnA antitoxin family protein [Stellaceae bacterium]|nr:BrnA antitoxin family protein [Stellaceae bacterium]